jgi:PadR family transcriptional regulator, regulatory protein PadR
MRRSGDGVRVKILQLRYVIARLPPRLFDLDKISSMAWSSRITGSLLDVSVCLLRAHAQDEKLHGWAIMKATKRSGPTVYGVLDRLEDRNWITGYWEENQDARSSKPRRRFYELTPEGLTRISDLLAERRPEALPESKRRVPSLTLPGRRSVAPGGAV